MQWLVKHTGLILLFFVLSNGSSAQKENYYLVDDLELESIDEYDRYVLDSCLKVYHSSEHDTMKMNAIYGIVLECWDDRVWPKYNQWVYDVVSKKLKNKDYENEVVKKNFIKNKAASINNFGYLKNSEGNILEALTLYLQSLKLMKSINHKEGMASTLNNIASIYAGQDDFDTALEYNQQSLEIAQENNDLEAQSISYTNLGALYDDMGDPEKALLYYERCLDLTKQLNDPSGTANALNNIAGIKEDKGEVQEAEAFYLEAIELLSIESNEEGLAIVLNNLADLYWSQNNIQKAKYYAKEALVIAHRIAYPSLLMSAYHTQFKINKQEQNWMRALYSHEQYIAMRDSVKNDENTRAVLNRKFQYEYQIQAAKDSIARAEENRIHAAEIMAEKAEKERHILASENHKLEAEQQKKQNFILYGGLAILLLLAAFIFNRFKVTQRQNAIIASQKNEVESQKQKIELQHQNLEAIHKEVSDSIAYAQRLQQAILPSGDDLNHHLKDGFVMYRPKDVVSGDFYWMQVLKDQVLIAVADCTGHGVPGAMVSVVCSNALNRSVKEFGLTDPAKILDKTRDLVIETFTLSGKEVKDGMDISLCALSKDYDESGTRHVSFAGANNPIWLVTLKTDLNQAKLKENKTVVGEHKALIELRPNKQPVGLYETPEPFSSQTLSVKKGEMLYLFTDGFADQFGGKTTSQFGNGKKYKYKPLKQFILNMNALDMDIQQLRLEEEFELWKGDFEQVDDVCIIGIRL